MRSFRQEHVGRPARTAIEAATDSQDGIRILQTGVDAYISGLDSVSFHPVEFLRFPTNTDLALSETPVRFSQGLVDSLQSSPEVGSQFHSRIIRFNSIRRPILLVPKPSNYTSKPALPKSSNVYRTAHQETSRNYKPRSPQPRI